MPALCVVGGMWQEEDATINPSSAGAGDVEPRGCFHHETPSTSLSCGQQSPAAETQRDRAPVEYYLDLRGSSFQPSQPTQSIADPADAPALPPSDPSLGGSEFWASGSTCADSLEQYAVTGATEDIFRHSADPTSTCARLENFMVSAAAAATATITRSADETVTSQVDCTPTIAEEDVSALFTPGLDSQVSRQSRLN